MHLESDIALALIFLLAIFVMVRYKPTVESIHSLVEMANTKGGIIFILWLTSLLFFLSGVRLMYWSITVQLQHPGDPIVAVLNTGFNWISGGAFGGSFAAMIATMKGEALPPPTPGPGSTTTQTTVETTKVAAVATNEPPPIPKP